MLIGGAVLLQGCAALLPIAAGGTAALVVAPQVPVWFSTITTGVTVLSDTAKLACATQAFANAIGNKTLSRDAGVLCSW